MSFPTLPETERVEESLCRLPLGRFASGGGAAGCHDAAEGLAALRSSLVVRGQLGRRVKTEMSQVCCHIPVPLRAVAACEHSLLC